ncbi:hypothetical protein Tsubulata_012539 [Turnera subulata]|uniref:Armadillo repeat-containing protein 8 n=1 Tax=Turnera subulata TaxID=218843 RepID=A0A9Q0F776_9ROSI|nr:hypothetical protein Tsubulata_012539 [Turnera subulata]
MPTPTSAPPHSAPDFLSRLASPDPEIKLKALRDIKNQIIGNRTKKLSFLKLGAVPAVASVLAASLSHSPDDVIHNIVVQSAAVLGSFACGFDAGVRAVLDSASFPHLLRLLSSPDDKVVDAAARSLRMIYQSKLAPKFDFLEAKNMEFLLSLLNSESENVSGLGASIITHSCESGPEQLALCDAGVLKKLINLLGGTLSQRNASLESLAAIFRGNPDVVSKFVEGSKNGSEVVLKCVGSEGVNALTCVSELTKDRNLRTRLLACECLIVIRNTCPGYLQDIGIKMKLVNLLIELLDDPGQVGDDAPSVFSSLITEKEDMQKLAFEANAVNKFCHHLQKNQLNPKRLQGVLLALSDLCAKLESCRLAFLSLKVLNSVTDALTHDSADVRSAACICLRNVTRSIKNLCAGYFMNEMLVIPLVRLLDDPSISVQVAALGAISNVVVDFTTRKSTFVQCGGTKQLVQLSKSMDSTLRLNALWALRNMMFLADDRCKETIILELTASLLASLIAATSTGPEAFPFGMTAPTFQLQVSASVKSLKRSDKVYLIVNLCSFGILTADPEPSIQEQALGFVRNLVDGCAKSIEFIFAEDGIILDAVGRQLQSASKAEIGIQGMYVLGNVASGNEFHKEAVMHQLLPQVDNGTQSFMMKFLQSNDSRLRTAAVWAIVNLTFPACPGAFSRVVKLKNAGIESQIRNMVNDPCLDVKLRARTVLTQSMTFSDGLT